MYFCKWHYICKILSMISFMRYILLAVFCLISSFAYPQGVAQDTIILVSNKVIVGKVQNVSSSKITLIKKDSQVPEEITRKQIHKIKYSNGRVEQFNSMAFSMVEESNFQAVIITDKPEDVDGLYAYGKIDSASGRTSKSAKAAEKNARIRLQRKAAAMGAMYVLITKSETRGGYKEVPTHFYEGIAYGIEPPKEQPK